MVGSRPGGGLWVNEHGELVAETELGPVKFTKPVAYQEIDGKRVDVAVDYILQNTKPETQNSKRQFPKSSIQNLSSTSIGDPKSKIVNHKCIYGFAVASYDRTKDLIIDPLLASTYLGRTGYDVGYSLALDTSGNVYVTGYTASTDFPTTSGAYDISFNGGYYDVFVSKLDGGLTSLLASTYLGGSGDDSGLLASTYGGGSGDDSGGSLVLDTSGNVYVTGHTWSTDFPTTSGAYDTSFNSGGYYPYDVFVIKLDGELTSLLASTYLGGSSGDHGRSLAIDPSGNVYVPWLTCSLDFPTTSGAYDTSRNNYGDVFVSKLDGGLTRLLASTYLGGSSIQRGNSLALDTSGNVYVTGFTYSRDFPTTSGAYDTSYNGGGGFYVYGADAFVSKLNSGLTSLLASTFLGGYSYEEGDSLALDTIGNIYVTGETRSANFPTTSGAYDTSQNGGFYDYNVFVSKLDGGLTSLLASTYLGGSSHDRGDSLALDTIGNIYVTGRTGSTDFPTTSGAYDDTSYNGSSTAFVSKLYITLYEDDCSNGIDDDFDGLTDCKDPDCCGNSTCVEKVCEESTLTETLLSQKAVMNNVEVSGDFSSTLNFTELEFVHINTGSFAGKGFSKGTCEVTLEGVSYKGEWSGVLFQKSQERKIYLKGAITGEIDATVEGNLTESVSESGTYDQYQATWKIGRLKNSETSATIYLNGTVSYQESAEYSNTEIRFLQTNIERALSGDYEDTVNIVSTHLRVMSEGNPYEGEGFSIISYTSESGTGEGWTYDKAVSPDQAELSGLCTSPYYGIASGTLIKKTLYLSIKRIDKGLPPMADLEVKTWGPQRVSPGQTVDYMIEYRNDGTRSADDSVVVVQLPDEVEYISSTNAGIYKWETNEVIWKLGSLLPLDKGNLSVKVTVKWGLSQGTQFTISALIGTNSDEKDVYTEGMSFLNVTEYLNYQEYEPPKVENFDTDEKLSDLLQDTKFADMYNYAISLGYETGETVKQVSTNDNNVTIILNMVTSAEDKSLSVNKITFSDETNSYYLLEMDGDSVSILDWE